jgi:SAM-dependent methyltransferase
LVVAWKIFEPAAPRYEDWYTTARGARASHAECALLEWLLGWFPDARSVLEVGSGTGHFTRWLAARMLTAIGLDRSPAMLRAGGFGSGAFPGLLADAHRLPLRERSVDLLALITTLEFLDAPAVALRECVRVAGRGVVVVALNRWSVGAVSRRIGPQSRGGLVSAAHDRSLSQLRRELREAAGGRLRGLHWRGVLLPRPLDQLVLPMPCGDVLGVAVVLGTGPPPAASGRSQSDSEPTGSGV